MTSELRSLIIEYAEAVDRPTWPMAGCAKSADDIMLPRTLLLRIEKLVHGKLKECDVSEVCRYARAMGRMVRNFDGCVLEPNRDRWHVGCARKWQEVKDAADALAELGRRLIEERAGIVTKPVV